MFDDWSDTDIVEELCEIDSGLTEWELEFVDSINEWVDCGNQLTEKQRKKAESILQEKGKS